MNDFGKSGRLNVLCLSEHYPPIIGGTVTYVENSCENLAKLGQNVYLVTYTTDNVSFPPKKWTTINGYHVFNVGLPLNIPIDTRAGRKYYCHEVKSILLNLISTLNVDVIHVMYGHYVAGLFNKLPLKIPVFWTVQNMPPAEYSPISPFQVPLLNLLVTKIYFSIVELVTIIRFKKYKFTTFIVSSEYVKKALINKRISSTKIIIIPNGVDDNIFRPVSDSNGRITTTSIFPKILSVAKISEHKGLHVLLSATLKIKRLYPDVLITIIGSIVEERYKKRLDETIKKYSLEANWTFITKKLCIDDLVDYYNKCDLYVQPSIEEGFCLTFLEASSCGKPVIGTNTGAMPDLIRFIGQTNGCFPGDSDCLANTVIQVASQPRNFQDSQKQHQIIISKYSWSSVTKQLLEFYHKQITQTN